ncbi:MAG: hypothetical protein JXO22_16610, partial [Phycisphaerae bacterium]|nr:hypothetical protein [Phycisphaerae bacterium]
VFYCGDNDIASGKTPERVADDFRTFAQLVHEKLPGTHVIYLPIKPSVSRWAFWPKMNEANELIRKFIAGDQLLTYVDTATPMLGTDEQPRADLLLDDGLHLNDKGYAIWNELVEPAIAKALATGKTTTTGND